MQADLNQFAKRENNPFGETQPETPNQSQQKIDQAYLSMLENQNRLLQQSLLTQQVMTNTVQIQPKIEPLQIGDPYPQAQPVKHQDDFDGEKCCKAFMLLASVVLAVVGYYINQAISFSNDYEAFLELYQYVGDIQNIPDVGESCAEFITFGYETLEFSEALIALGVIGGIIVCFSPVAVGIGGIIYTIASGYNYSQASGNGCESAWSTITNWVPSDVHLPSNNFILFYQTLAETAAFYSIFALITVCLKKK